MKNSFPTNPKGKLLASYEAKKLGETTFQHSVPRPTEVGRDGGPKGLATECWNVVK